MANIDKIQVGSTTYDIVSSASATNTFTSSDVADGSATTWTTVATLASGETTSSIFAKISQMFKNIRYLYRILKTEVTVSVPSSGWTADSTYGYKNAVTLSGVTTSSKLIIDITRPASTAQATWEAMCEAYGVYCATGWASPTAANTITFYCSEAPTANFTVSVINIT